MDRTSRINKKLCRELTDAMLEQRGGVNDCLNLRVVSKCLERVADHAVSMAGEAVYLCEGEDIRHAGRERSNAGRAGDLESDSTKMNSGEA